MSLIVTWYADDRTISAPMLVLCQSDRTVAEHNVRLNGRRITEAAELYRADTVQDFDRANARIRLSFEVMRDRDFAPNTNGATFLDPEAAFVAAALHIGDSNQSGYSAIRGTGRVVFALTGAYTTATLTFNNATLESNELSDWMGVAITIPYVFNCASVTKT